MEPEPDPDRHLKRLHKVFGVSKRIQTLAIKRRRSLVTISKEEKEREQDEIAKDERQQRMSTVTPMQQYVLELVAEFYGVDSDVILDGMADDEKYLMLVESLFIAGGKQAVMFFYKLFGPPSIKSGRLNLKNKYEKVVRAICTDGTDNDLGGKCVIAYRISNQKNITMKNIGEEIQLIAVEVSDTESALTGLSKFLNYITHISTQNYRDFGACNPGQKIGFLHGFDNFLKFFKSTSLDIQDQIYFEVVHELYKGFLLVPFQIKETSLRKDKVSEVEKSFERWLRQIEIAIYQGSQIRRENIEVGPLNELEHWMSMLTKYSAIVEFVQTRPFLSHLQCLVLSRSKLVTKWMDLDRRLTSALCEARDNMRYMSLMEKFWDTLYKSDPPEIQKNLVTLLATIRSIYKTSLFFNTSESIGGFFTKVTNQLTIACKSFLTNRDTLIIWKQANTEIIEKIKLCEQMLDFYHALYFQTLENMESKSEQIWECSPSLIFGNIYTFKKRMAKIHTIMETQITYSVLDRIQISGMEDFAKNIKAAIATIIAKPYNPLAHRSLSFDNDYEIFLTQIEQVELKMQKFVKDYIKDVPSSIGILSILNRFEKLNLDCLCLDRRYLDAAMVLEKEVESIKDVYQEFRNDPPVQRCGSPVAGRILWARSLFKRIDDPLQIIKKRPCVLEHKNCQLCIKLYNYISPVLLHYEMLHHKAWFDYSGEIHRKLNLPIMILNDKSGKYEINLHDSIRATIKETETMWKLGLPISIDCQMLTYCKDRIINSYEVLKSLIVRNNKLRLSIHPVLVNVMKPQLKRIALTFKPGLSVVTWKSPYLEEFFETLNSTLTNIEIFSKKVTDILTRQIEDNFASIAKSNLIDLPDYAVSPTELISLNNDRRQLIEKKIAIKSQAIEKSVVDLINNFVLAVHVKDIDSQGRPRYQLPPDEITPTNWRTEELKPIDKWDWICFSKIARTTIFVTEEQKEKVLFKDYETFYYELTQLHNDAMDLFSYFNNCLISSLCECTKKSLERLKIRSNLANIQLSIIETSLPLFITSMEINIEKGCYLVPSLEKIQEGFAAVIQNVVETHYGINTWGKQAKTAERKKRKPLKDEIIQERNMFKTISEHKDTTRSLNGFAGGLILLNPDVKALLNRIYDKYKYLWSSERVNIITEFVQSNPLTIYIREKFMYYDSITESLQQLNKTTQVGPILINMEKVNEFFVDVSREWKSILGQQISSVYKKRLGKVVEFINDMEKILNRPLKDLDDVRLAMNCLESIREHFIEIDLDLILMIDTYQMFSKFNIFIPKDDYDRVDSLKYNFERMVENSKRMSKRIAEMEQPLLAELCEGVASFNDEINVFHEDFELNGPLIEGLPAKEASDRTFLFYNKFEELLRKFEMYASGEKLFGLPLTEYPILNQHQKDFNLLNKLYSLYIIVLKTIDGYYETPWLEINVETITEEIQDFQIKCKKLPKGMKEWPAFIDLKKKIDDFNEACPLLELMTNSAVKDRHWDKLEQILNYKLDVFSSRCTLGNVMEAPLLENKDDVEDVCVGAIKEKDIEAKLKQTINDWSAINLSMAPFKGRNDMLLKGNETLEVISLLEDSLMVMNSLASNRYNAPFKKMILLWLSKLSITGEILEKWMIVQNLWVYLEAVFVGGDIARQLPGEAKRFSNIDKSYVRLMYRARENPNVIECCAGDDVMQNTLPYLIEQLEACQKSLSGYLETKRLIFPRFFFVSDPVLLEILGQASNPTTIQPHLLSIFDAIAVVEFEENTNDKIISMVSANGEVIRLDHMVRCQGGVELWLGKLLNEMKDTVKTLLANIASSLADPNFNFVIEFQQHSGQAGLVGVQTLWTQESEYALKKSKVDKNIMKLTNQRFLDLLNAFIELTVLDLTKLQRIRYETIVTIHVHQRDIFDDLVRFKIKSLLDFEWQKQARFYYEDKNDDILVKITDVNFIYQDEYLGVTERLAITPLTDRCYITLAQSIGMSMGGAPAGPAGTGKTETTKDMGRALGKLVVVFNCSDQMDFRGLGRIYKGLAQSGSWGCFDEFNRIELPVLSVAAQQISIVLNARKEKKSFFIFSDGDTVAFNPELGIFITMNPGYAGRQELPENLKIQFRTVAMMVPDRQIIIRVKLASCGFKENIVLSRKFFTLYKLCEEQLSKQVHYDFGLRNILSVLRTLGAQKRANPLDTEETIVMRVLRDMNLSKLVDEDEPLFISLIGDLFPGIKLSTSSYKDLQRAIVSSVNKLKLINHPEWNLKIVQLYETSLVRHGLMAMGPTGAGKTSSITVLLKSFTEMGDIHKELRMNPKAITASQMFGRLDAATNDWTDGIFSTLWRRTLKIKKSEFIWLILDGPVDAVWIENLNSVLDDNKTLTLANGDRIVMAQNCKLVFEPDNVDNASPATVSRVGMVFMSESVLKWSVLLNAWLKLRTPDEAAKLSNLFSKIYEDLNLFVQVKCVPKMKILESLYIRQCLDILSGMLTGNASVPVRTLERMFLFALMWSLGGLLEQEDRAKMEEFVLKHPSKLRWPKLQRDETIFEYSVSSSGDWQHWSQRIEEYIYPTDSVPDYSSILVPNVDNVRTGFLIDIISQQKKAVLLIGEQGTAKTVMIKGYLSQYDPEEHISKSLNFSSATTPNMFQRIIESYVEKRVGLNYGPPGQRLMTVFIDDINMPVVNEWGDQITNEIVRQLMEANGFYSLDKPGDFLTILDIQLIAAMIHPGGGRNDIPNRLKRHFCIFNCTLPSNSSMDKIFRIIGEGYFCSTRFNSEIVEFVPNLIPLTRVLWQQTKLKLLPTPAKFHYVFNLRDLSRIWQGILQVAAPECKNIAMLLKLWRHECIRVIADRLINQEDKNWFYERINIVAEMDLGSDFSEYSDEDTYFVDFLRDPPEPTGEEGEDFSLDAPKVYEEIPSEEFVTNKVYSFMEQLNEQVRGVSLDLVFFHDALVHLIIISRILSMPRGNALLVGVGGSGKQSLTKLASFIANYKFYQITLTKAYTISNLLEDIKYLYITAGFEGQGISFIFTDNDIKEESFLEYLNNVLSSGEVANLFPKDELDAMLNELIPVMKKIAPKRIPTLDILFDFFITRARSNLHIVLCFSPIGEKFRNRALKFPGLISGCTIDWFQKWPADARVAVSRHYLKSFLIVCTDIVKDEVIQMMSFLQNNVSESCLMFFERFRRQVFVTPKSLLSLLGIFKKIYSQMHANIQEMAKRMQTGLHKLIEAADAVGTLKVELEITNIKIVEATERADVILADVSEVAAAAEIVKAQVAKIKNDAEILVDNISADKAVAEGKLEVAKPALEEAENALKTIKSADIATVRKLGKPPYLITLIMDCVLIFFKKKIEHTKPDLEKKFIVSSWAESLKVMGDTRFLAKILDYQKDYINAEIIDLLQPYFRFPNYNFDAAKLACGNVAGLLSWTFALAKYFQINKEVLPLKANLAVQEIKYNKATTQLKNATALLATKEADLAKAEATLTEANSQKQIVLDEAKLCQDKMDAAKALIEGLADERVRWTEQLTQFKNQTSRLVGDVIYLAAFLSYTGPFNQEFRTGLCKQWFDEIINRGIPISANINVIESLTDSATTGEWNLEGLPADELSIQNGIIVTNAVRFPLLIDPQSQGKFWIKNREAKNGLIVTQLTHKYFRTHIEDAISLGLPILIEDVFEELDPLIDNVLEKNLIKMGSSYKVKVGDKEVDYNADFRLYITSKLANPLFTPEISARTSVINFTVTMKGLEDQLLGRVILKEKKELEEERKLLIRDVTANRRKMMELEANLLHKLSTTQGSLLDDVSVIIVLNTSKETATEVKEKLNVARTTEIKINAAREEFRGVAIRGSVLYFLICTMASVNYMYQTSLNQFLERFDISLDRSEKSQMTHRRIGFIIEYLTYEIFKYKSRGLFERDKYLFALLMSLNIDSEKGKLTFEELQIFIKGGAALDINICPPKPYKWITDITWLNLVQLTNLRQFQNIILQISSNERPWKHWFEKDQPEEEIIPDGYNNIDVFRKLLLIRAWCPDRTISQSRKYIASSLGERFAAPVVLNYESMFEESFTLSPLICFLSMGSDPTTNIEILAKRNEVKLRAISMGQGQEIHARKLINESLEDGNWVLLQNCHLGLEYMNELVSFILNLEKTGTESVADTFRLWITTEEHPTFPITLLQISIKYTNEPPSGVRAGLARTYGNISQDMLDYSESPFYLPLIYAVSFLHTIVQERRKFGPLGWNIPYEFNSADWLASCLFMQNHLDDLDPKRGISWSTVRYMIGEVQYGGRVTDDYDKILLNTFAKEYFSEKLFHEEFEFYNGYGTYKFKVVQDYINAIEEMPTVDPPLVYGLHSNADITYQSNTTQLILDTIISVQPKESSGSGGELRETVVTRIAIDMLEKSPLPYDKFEVMERLREMGLLSSMNIFLRQEIDRMQKIIDLVRTTLEDLLLAIEGTIIMNEELRDALDNIYDARVPNVWKRGSWASSTLGFWFTEFLERNHQLKEWCFGGRPITFWMSGFFNPQGFLTAMRQEVTRAHKGWALDVVSLHNEVTKLSNEDCKKPPKEGVFVHGLYIEGAGWDRKNTRLCEATNKILNTLMPVVHIYAINSTAAKDSKLFQCPVYKKPNRTDLNYITPLWLSSLKSPEHWTLRGVALLCDIK